VTARAWRRRGRRLPWLRRDAVQSAAALAALFGATGCGSGTGASEPTTTAAPTTTAEVATSAASSSSTPAPATTTTAAVPTTAKRATNPAATTTVRPTTIPAMATTTLTAPQCYTRPDGTQACLIPGRPLRRHRSRRLLLPAVSGLPRPDDEARAEYASVASFGELALRLLAVGAPADLVAACHQAALDEIRHASVCERLAGRPPAPFGAIPGLLGRRLGGWRRSRPVQLQRIAVESFLDGWVNEGAAADELRGRAERADSPEEQAALRAMAADEQRHADLARAIVTWCFEQEPDAVGRALGQVAPLPVAA